MKINIKEVVRNAYEFPFLLIYSKEHAVYFSENTSKLMKDFLFYKVKVKPDLTEGRWYAEEIILASHWEVEENAVFAYLMKNYGKPVSFVQGYPPMKTYDVYSPKKYKDWLEVKDKKVIYLNYSGEECQNTKNIEDKLKVIFNESDKA